MFIKVIVACLIVGLLSTQVQAQQPAPVCSRFELPSQRQDNPALVGGFAFNVPYTFPNGVFVGTYPPSLSYVYPTGATRVGLISWSVIVPAKWADGQIIPKNSVHVWGLSCGAGYCSAVDFFNNDDEGLWVSDALSRPMNPGETYMLGLFNYNKRDVTIEVVVSGQVCK